MMVLLNSAIAILIAGCVSCGTAHSDPSKTIIKLDSIGNSPIQIEVKEGTFKVDGEGTIMGKYSVTNTILGKTVSFTKTDPFKVSKKFTEKDIITVGIDDKEIQNLYVKAGDTISVSRTRILLNDKDITEFQESHKTVSSGLKYYENDKFIDKLTKGITRDELLLIYFNAIRDRNKAVVTSEDYSHLPEYLNWACTNKIITYDATTLNSDLTMQETLTIVGRVYMNVYGKSNKLVYSGDTMNVSIYPDYAKESVRYLSTILPTNVLEQLGKFKPEDKVTFNDLAYLLDLLKGRGI